MHRCMARTDHPDPLGRAAAEVKYAAFDKRATVVDPYRDRPAIARIGNAHSAAKWQRLVSGRHCFHVEPLAIGGQTSVKAAAVIRCDPHAEIATWLLKSWFEDCHVDRTSRPGHRKWVLVVWRELLGKVRLHRRYSCLIGMGGKRSKSGQRHRASGWINQPGRAATRSPRMGASFSHRGVVYRRDQSACKWRLDNSSVVAPG